MNLEEKNEKLLEYFGWKKVWWNKDWRGRPDEPKEMWLAPGEKIPNDYIFMPRYFWSLNDIHQAEKSLQLGVLAYYHNLLCDLYEEKAKVSDDPNLHKVRMCRSMAISATAAERAEALGKTLKLWD